MPICVIIDTFKSDDVIRKLESAILVLQLMTSLLCKSDVTAISTVMSHHNPTN